MNTIKKLHNKIFRDIGRNPNYSVEEIKTYSTGTKFFLVWTLGTEKQESTRKLYEYLKKEGTSYRVGIMPAVVEIRL